MHIYTHIQTHTCIHIYISTNTNIYVYAHIYRRIFVLGQVANHGNCLHSLAKTHLCIGIVCQNAGFLCAEHRAHSNVCRALLSD